MKEAYCSDEVYRLLLNKGFNGETHTTYDGEGYTKVSITHQMAMAWLREKNIGIVPEVHTTQDPKDYYWGACIFYLDKSWNILKYVSEPSKDIVEGYDAAIEQALKYCLENLI